MPSDGILGVREKEESKITARLLTWATKNGSLFNETEKARGKIYCESNISSSELVI